MNKKGFTLVELLAVIVILAIVALVTVPAILNVINDSREKGAEDKAWGTIEAVKSAYAQAQMSGYEDAEGNGVSVSGDNLIVTFSNGTEAFGSKKITMTGERPTSGTVTINKNTGDITCNDLYFKGNGKFYCTTTDGKSMKCNKGNKGGATGGSSIGGIDVAVVTSGDGLYADSTESGRYVYKGASPDNYIKLGSDTYRIIAKEADGTLKVIRNDSIGNIDFDAENARYSTVSTDYCNSPYGCKVWGSKTTTLNSSGSNVTMMPREVGGTLYNLPETEATLNTYLNTTWLNTLSTDVQSKIITHIFNVGGVRGIYGTSGQTLATDISHEQAYKWKGKVGLMNITDYVKSNSNVSLCGTVYANGYSAGNYSTCKTTSWIFASLDSSIWTITPDFGPYSDDTFVGTVDNAGAFSNSSASNGSIYGVAPVFYLSSDITLKGKGTLSNPYTISV